MIAPLGNAKGVGVIQIENQARQMAEAIGLAKRRAAKRRKGKPSCEECFFHCQMLCALDLDEPCSTFRPNSSDGLVPPRQPALLPRQAAEEQSATAA
jgi:hypothetical protein